MLNQKTDPYNALQAKSVAQKLAFAPIVFQTARSLRDLGILSALEKSGKKGLCAEHIAQQTEVSEYGVKVLLDMAISANMVTWDKPNYYLANLGYFILHDDMTRANMDFTADVCYAGMMHLTEAIKTGTPSGLVELGDWDTIYQGLSKLPEQAKKSWFEFDHFYSDRAFPELLKLVFAAAPKKIVDIGGNTGKWTIQCCTHDSQVEVTIVDLPQQLAMAMENVRQAGYQERVHAFPADMLDKQQELPEQADIWWMSQFLDCFSPLEIINILKKVRAKLTPNDRIYILELFWDTQRYEAAAFSLNATSLYFTCLANGNSRFYRSDDFMQFIEAAGLSVEERLDDVGMGHTLLKLKA
ncbi:MAG: class I SAM-dependent methyltransferase [Thiopseudomonas sp.]|nr:class I SAM-dependent methyltransferase [Thiopseudomonas sp.]MCK9465405.1 class I SAM-dependent methyltransferase [Thiopseudomonas sp.]